MKIAIYNSNSDFHLRWINYCRDNNIRYKLVNCSADDIIRQIYDCSALMWHFSQSKSADIIMAKQLLFALQHKGFRVFPDFNTSWHFDDKLGQKYLLESLDIPFVKTYVFFNKKDAIDWVSLTGFPKVFKLRGGAGSGNVRLVESKKKALKLINKAFGKGFRQYDKYSNLSERWRKYRNNKTDLLDVVKGIIRVGYEPDFSKTIGNERGYVYFQDFIPGNNFDIRVVIIGDKAFAIKRMVRENDFRASGSGFIEYAKENFDESVIKLSFDINNKIKSQCLALDYVFVNNHPLVLEISYGFSPEGYDSCEGYWDKNLNWYEGHFNPYGWMVENIIRTI